MYNSLLSPEQIRRYNTVADHESLTTAKGIKSSYHQEAVQYGCSEAEYRKAAEWSSAIEREARMIVHEANERYCIEVEEKLKRFALQNTPKETLMRTMLSKAPPELAPDVLTYVKEQKMSDKLLQWILL